MKLQDTYDLLLQFERCSNSNDVSRIVLSATERFGVEHYFAGVMPPRGASSKTQLEHVIGGEWPKEWATRYFAQQYIDKDQTIEHVRRSDRPLIWSKAQDQTKDAKRIMNEAASFGLGDGITIPQSSLDGFKVGISFSGRYMDTDDPEVSTILTVVGSNAVTTLTRCANRDIHREKVHLSYREKEVLYWVAEGKTSFEIGIILTIATATVEKHFRAVLTKLGSAEQSTCGCRSDAQRDSQVTLCKIYR